MAEKKGEQSMPEVDVLLKGMLAQPGVDGFMVFNEDGIPLKWTTTGFVKPGAILGSQPIPPAIVHHAALIGDLAAKSKATLKRLLGDADGELSLIRLHTKVNEIVIAPTAEATLVTVQRAHLKQQGTIVEVAEAAFVAAAAADAQSKGAKK